MPNYRGDRQVYSAYYGKMIPAPRSVRIGNTKYVVHGVDHHVYVEVETSVGKVKRYSIKYFSLLPEDIKRKITKLLKEKSRQQKLRDKTKRRK